MRTRALFFTALALAASARVRASDPSAAKIEARVRQYAEADLFSGVVLVARGDAIVYQGAFGLADRGFGVPNTPATRFHIASVSKPITAAAILLLADRGRLALETPVAEIFPGFPHGERITVEEVLTHYSGLADTSGDPDYAEWSRFPQTPASLVERLAKKPLQDEPGRAYHYSNSNYHLLARIVEVASGRSYGEFLEENVFRPLAMTGSAHPERDETIVPVLASGYMPLGAEGFAKPPLLDWTSKTGNGSLYATAADLLKFHRALQHGGLLRPDTVTASYGFGRPDRQVGAFWFRRERDGRRSVYVGGSSPGFKAHFERFIDDDVAVIILSNVYVAAPSVMASDVAALLWDLDPKLPAVPRRTARPRAELDRLCGDYRFGPDFYTPNLAARIERDGDILVLAYPDGTTRIPLLPVGAEFFDRLYWSFVRFEEGRLVYRNGDSKFVAAREKRP
jgi:CubicO group peptidase (beta-lactamase class C family)